MYCNIVLTLDEFPDLSVSVKTWRKTHTIQLTGRIGEVRLVCSSKYTLWTSDYRGNIVCHCWCMPALIHV